MTNGVRGTGRDQNRGPSRRAPRYLRRRALPMCAPGEGSLHVAEAGEVPQLLEHRVEDDEHGSDPQEERRPAAVEGGHPVLAGDGDEALQRAGVWAPHLRRGLVARHHIVRGRGEHGAEEGGDHGGEGVEHGPVLHQLRALRQRRLRAVVAEGLPRAEERTADHERPGAAEEAHRAALAPDREHLPHDARGLQRGAAAAADDGGRLEARLCLEERARDPVAHRAGEEPGAEHERGGLLGGVAGGPIAEVGVASHADAEEVAMEDIVATTPGLQSPAIKPSEATIPRAKPSNELPPAGAEACCCATTTGLSCQRTRRVSKGLKSPVAVAAAVPAQRLFRIRAAASVGPAAIVLR
eukprot:CAMPEP_0176259292 /NCGR_PEP_ID=MMETSP0121_2-20121125/38999_1 /TAXON_ID=160619 /ORGANISM="Kryptoperidinium foliaceum, Strain CCMP 1326" /LENGTH=352 /DNA_ID=CAMNT_0017599181 /DNA_START=78 /DNA_END=1134 /DNA_ORIENTATION=+